MARAHITLLQQLIIERRLTRQQAIKVLCRRADLMGVDDFAVSTRQFDRWLAGEVATMPRPSICRVIEAEFRQPVERLLAPLDQPSTTPVTAQPGLVEQRDITTMVRTAAWQSARFGQRADGLGIGDLAMDILWQRLGALATEYVYAPMGPVFAHLVAFRDEVVELLVEPDPVQARDLYLVAGITCGILACASGDLGYSRAAQIHASTALICAQKADHRMLAAWVLGVLALDAECLGLIDDALSLVDKAHGYVRNERLPSTVSVWLAAIAARAHARQGHKNATLVALRQVAEYRDRVGSVPDTESHPFDSIGGILTFTQAKQHYYTGTAYRRIGDFASARRHSQAAITAYCGGDAEQRSYGDEMIARIDLATASVSDDSPDLDTAGEAFAVVEYQPSSRCLPMLLGPLRDLHDALSHARVRDARHAIRIREGICELTASCHRPVGIDT